MVFKHIIIDISRKKLKLVPTSVWVRPCRIKWSSHRDGAASSTASAGEAAPYGRSSLFSRAALAEPAGKSSVVFANGINVVTGRVELWTRAGAESRSQGDERRSCLSPSAGRRGYKLAANATVSPA